jgi:predicted nucleic acid-binding protein
MRIFLDPNILFSAGKSAGAMRGFLEVLKYGCHTLVADAYVVEEARRNLEAKFPASLKDFEVVLYPLESSATLRCFLPPGLAPELPEKDRPILASAIQRRCDVLLTSDKTHFGPLYGKCLEGVTIHSHVGLAKHLSDEATDRPSTPA